MYRFGKLAALICAVSCGLSIVLGILTAMDRINGLRMMTISDWLIVIGLTFNCAMAAICLDQVAERSEKPAPLWRLFAGWWPRHRGKVAIAAWMIACTLLFMAIKSPDVVAGGAQKLYASFVDFTEGTANTAPSGHSSLSVDSGTHKLKASLNGAAPVTVPTKGGSDVDLNSTDITGTVQVGHGGTGLTVGTSGGIPYFSSTSAMTSSGALTQHAIVVGGGAGASPTPVASLGTSTTLLHGAAAGDPTWSAVSLTADVSGTLPATNGGTGTATVATGDLLYGSGTNTWSKLSGNATGNNQWLRSVSAGAPSWNAITCSDVTGLGTGGILYGNVSTGTALSIGSAGQVLTVNAAGTAPSWVSQTVNNNYLINGGMDWPQRAPPSSGINFLTTGNYGFDKWKAVAESNGTATTRSAASSGNSAAYEQVWTNTGGSKCAMWQTVEYGNTKPLQSRAVTFQFNMKASTATTMRLGVFEWTGTADAPTNLFTNPTSADGTDPSKNASWAALTATNVSNTTIDATPGNSAGTCSVTTSWQTFAVTVTVGSGSNNLAFAVWSHNNLANAQTVSFAQAGAYDGTLLKSWYPRQPQQELALCQRFCFVPGILPDSTLVTGANTPSWASGLTTTSTNAAFIIQLPVSMFKSPTISMTGSQWIALDGTTNSAISGTPTVSVFSGTSFRLDCTIAGAGASRGCILIGDGTGGRRAFFDADF